MDDLGDNVSRDSEALERNVKLTCPACGTTARRGLAQFCATCGRSLSDTYRPADALRASYHAHRSDRSFFERVSSAYRRSISIDRLGNDSRSFAAENRNGASTTALAFATYALVPYLGILFCPGAVLMGGVGLVHSFRLPHVGGRRASYASVVFGLLILCIQLVLWWILYKVPDLAQGQPL